MHVNFRKAGKDIFSKVNVYTVKVVSMWEAWGTAHLFSLPVSSTLFYSYFIFLLTQHHLGILQMPILGFYPKLNLWRLSAAVRDLVK